MGEARIKAIQRCLKQPLPIRPSQNHTNIIIELLEDGSESSLVVLESPTQPFGVSDRPQQAHMRDVAWDHSCSHQQHTFKAPRQLPASGIAA